jgi:phosphoglycolate phosphatase (TIGR01487 family)
VAVRARKGRPEKGEVKALAVDIDGTLADDSRRVSLEAVAALRKVQDSGVQVMLASGNVLPIAYGLSNYLGLTGPIIAENGGIVFHCGKVWTLGDAERLFTDKWRETEIGLRREVDLEKVKHALEGWDVEVETTGWAVHIMSKGMNKFVGVRKAAELLDITVKDIAAIGDSDNDEMMIRECGWGIAVGNAFVGTKKAASFVAKGKDGMGVVEGLAWLGLL